ncbi:MAG: DUF3422 domain-containing protein [Rhodospirillales bacterium]|nr:DUF3422 domain-containing protein [Rhodospirillales bacterium]
MLPSDHLFRRELNDEVHARPPEALVPPLRISYLALYSDWTESARQLDHVGDLAHRFGASPPIPGANFYSADFGAFRLKWERHTEFARYMITAADEDDRAFAAPPIGMVPHEWLAGLIGQTIAAAHVLLVRSEGPKIEHEAISINHFGGAALVGSSIAGARGAAFTDFHIHEDGFSRFVVQDRAMAPLQAGRMVQRLLEIDTYRMLAFLALPAARRMSPVITKFERELAEVTAALAGGTETDEPMLLDRLTRLDAAIETRQVQHFSRFSAAAVYYELVQRRIAELREEQIQGLQTFHEFTERRLAPAMSTCRTVAARHDALSQRVARTTQLLSTRVDLTRELQNRAILESMERRAKLQLRLQQAVEGLSAAAAIYYLVSLVGYAAKGGQSIGIHLDANTVMAASIPLVAALVALVLRQIRRAGSRPQSG